MISRRTTLRASAGIAAGFVSATPAAAQGLADLLWPPNSLEEVALRIERDYRNLSHLRTESLVARLGAAEPMRLYDVREVEEFNVSRLRGAQRLSPSASSTEAVRQIGDDPAGQDLVFYCSVGRRSSRMAERLQDVLLARGARGVHNLRGGIFAWHNLSLPLFNAGGPTPYVHPFSAAWERLLDHPALASTFVR